MITLSIRFFSSVLLLLPALSICSHGTAGTSDDTPANPYVKSEITLMHPSLPPGGKSEILFSLTPAEGIHITAEPAPEFRIDSGRVAKTRGTPLVKKDSHGFIPQDSPVRQTIVIAPKAEPGEYRIRGTFTYYYCSDSEGWCMRYRQAVALTVIVKN